MNSDEFGDPVLGHEFGHFVQKVHANDMSPGGGHLEFEGKNYDPCLAFGEGFASFFQAVVRSQPDYPSKDSAQPSPLFGTPAALNREFYSVTALNTGKILIAGGWDGTNPMGTCFLFDPETKTFTETGAMVIARSGAKAALLKDGRVLVAEGYGNRSIVTGIGTVDMGQLPNAEIYDPVSGTWSSSARFEQQDVNQGGSLVALPDGRALILGGDTYSGNNASNSVLFDGTNGFSTLSKDTLSWGKWFPMVQLKDGRVLYSGGYTGAPRPPGNTDADWKIMQAAWLYNPADSTAVAAGTMVSKRMEHTATVLPDGKVLLVGGISHNRTPYGDYSNPDGWEPTATAEIYDPVAGTFTATGSLQIPRADHAAILLPTGQVMVAGGWTRMDYLPDRTPVWYYQNSVETYDPDTGTWSLTDLLMNGNDSYGLDMPKLALQADGGVFVAGKPIGLDAPAAPVQGLAAGGKTKTFAAKGMRGQRGQMGNPMTLGSAALAPSLSPGQFFLQLGASTKEVKALTVNQGVTRYLQAFEVPASGSSASPTVVTDYNTPGNVPTNTDLAWKAQVPLVSGRRSLVKGDFVFGSKVKDPVSFWVEWVDQNGAVTKSYSAQTSSGGVKVSFIADVPAINVGEGRLQIRLEDKAGTILTGQRFQSAPSFQPSAAMIVYLYPVQILKADGTPIAFDFDAEVTAQMEELRRDIIRYFPVGEDRVMVLKRDWPQGFTRPVWDGRTSADGPMLTPTKWDEFVKMFRKGVWDAGIVPQDLTTPPDFHMALFPPEPGLTNPGSELGVNGIVSGIGEHFGLAHGRPFSNTQTQFFAVHELGHTLGRYHSPWKPGGGVPAGSELSGWPTDPAYRGAMLGVNGWDALLDHEHLAGPRGTSFKERELKTERDLMCHPDGSPTGSQSTEQKPDRYWVSDFTFLNLFRPLPTLLALPGVRP